MRRYFDEEKNNETMKKHICPRHNEYTHISLLVVVLSSRCKKSSLDCSTEVLVVVGEFRGMADGGGSFESELLVVEMDDNEDKSDIADLLLLGGTLSCCKPYSVFMICVLLVWL